LIYLDPPTTTCPVIDKKGKVVNHVNCPRGSGPIMLQGVGSMPLAGVIEDLGPAFLAMAAGLGLIWFFTRGKV
jgi:hypothetical protein